VPQPDDDEVVYNQKAVAAVGEEIQDNERERDLEVTRVR
jgi:hypothetical protein